MQENVEHLFAQNTQRQTKLPLPLLHLFLHVLLYEDFSIWIFTSTIINNFKRYF